MKVLFGKLFIKDLVKIKEVTLKNNVLSTIVAMENTNNILLISNIKKIEGHPEAYRIRIGKCRLGFFFDGETIELHRFAKREDIYKLFP